MVQSPLATFKCNSKCMTPLKSEDSQSGRNLLTHSVSLAMTIASVNRFDSMPTVYAIGNQKVKSKIENGAKKNIWSILRNVVNLRNAKAKEFPNPSDATRADRQGDARVRFRGGRGARVVHFEGTGAALLRERSIERVPGWIDQDRRDQDRAFKPH